MYRTEFENLRVYQLAEQIADLAWKVVGGWEHLAQQTVGIQFIKSADSMGANIAEGSGRGSPAEKKRFAKIARGSLFEVKHWLRRAYKRQLLSDSEVISEADRGIDTEVKCVYQRHQQEARRGLGRGKGLTPQPTCNLRPATCGNLGLQALNDTELNSGEDL